MKPAVRVTITGAAGNIGYAAAFRIAAGGMLDTDQPIILQLIEIEPALDALRKEGSYAPLQPTNPPQTPVSW